MEPLAGAAGVLPSDTEDLAVPRGCPPPESKAAMAPTITTKINEMPEMNLALLPRARAGSPAVGCE
ncbi:MAG: hypothetical protein NVSMB25_12280 [Thermoleophilaceae bacterium]